MFEILKYMYILANWKNKLSSESSKSLANDIYSRLVHKYLNIEIVIFPDDISLLGVKSILDSLSIVKIGAQDGPLDKTSSLTGSISAPNLSNVCDYVLLGHSERRIQLGETNEMVALKASVAIELGLVPVICVTKGTGTALDPYSEIKAQLESIQDHIRRQGKYLIAYEPIDAIGTGISGDPQEIKNTAETIRKMLSGLQGSSDIPVLYGGSVNAKNVNSFLSLEGIDGVLVGGESLNVDSFLKIVQKASDTQHLR